MKRRASIMAWLVGALVWPMAGPAGADLSREEWVEGMEHQLPMALCKEGSYFRTCFQVTRAECDRAARAGLRACLEEMEGDLPDALSDKEAEGWSHDLGACVGMAMADGLDDRRVAGERCKRK
jgi:hypothetical protein